MRIIIALAVLGATLIAAQAFFPPQADMAAIVTQRGPHDYVDLEQSQVGADGHLDYVSPTATLKRSGRDEELEISSHLSDPITGELAGMCTMIYTQASELVTNKSVPLPEIKWVEFINASGGIVMIGVRRDKLSRWTYLREIFFHWS